MSKDAIQDKPTDAATIERSFSLVDEAVHAVALQRQRIKDSSPAFDHLLFMQPWIDFQFFIVALRRLRRAAEIACHVPTVAQTVRAAIQDFDNSLPNLALLRNVGEHIDDYAMDSPNRKHNVSRRELQVATWNRDVFGWLGQKINIDAAHSAATKLHAAVRQAHDSFKN